MRRITLILLVVILLNFLVFGVDAAPVGGNSNTERQPTNSAAATGGVRNNAVQPGSNGGAADVNSAISGGAVNVSGGGIGSRSGGPMSAEMISTLTQEICDNRIKARNFINDPSIGSFNEYIQICEKKLLSFSFEYSLSILLFLISLQLYIKSSQFKHSENVDNFQIYNKIKNIIFFPIIISIIFYLFFIYMINIIWNNNLDNFDSGTVFIEHFTLFFVSVNNTTCLLLLIFSFLLALFAFWQFNLALPSGLEKGDRVGRAFALVTPLLSMLASILTIVKIVGFAELR